MPDGMQRMLDAFHDGVAETSLHRAVSSEGRPRPETKTRLGRRWPPAFDRPERRIRPLMPQQREVELTESRIGRLNPESATQIIQEHSSITSLVER